jgi:hypothetical protein
MLQSSYAPKAWVRAAPFSTPIVSYDQRLWFQTTWENLAEKRYSFPTPADEVAYNQYGEVVGTATKAAEATPKYVPPLFEEREI